ncbi:MAG: GNAT family N-acetyltransferase [Acidobacteria bacterium]|nr:GNAT family N-acetyltransferase [Acidobacteriota bacterium]MBV9484042.1 GNAT family N-acetyltransferase [Acidobacteriota bacterium]
MNPEFIEASLSEVERILLLIKAYYLFDGIPFGTDEVRSALEVLLGDPSLGRIWLIRLDQVDAGYITLTFGYDLEFGGREATVTEFYLREEYRRIGIGTKAFGFLEEKCRTWGLAALELQVERDNVQAQRFYRKLGFRAHNRIPLSKRLGS